MPRELIGALWCASASDISNGPWKLCTSIAMAGLWVHWATLMWNAADAEALAKLALARQAVARLQAAVADQRLDLGHDDLRDAVDVNGTEHVWWLRRVRGLRGLGSRLPVV